MRNIKVYSTESCPHCIMAKDFLKEKNIDFIDIDVSADRGAAEEMIEKSGQMGVPVILIGEEVIVGFDKEKLIEILNLK